MSFSEVREYVPGDDIRLIDWNVTARTGDPFIKIFQEERELTVILMVDMSASGQFGTASKLKTELAAELAAVLGFSAIKNNDKVGVIFFTDEVEKYIPPKKGRSRALFLIHELLSFKPKGVGTDVNKAIEFLHQTTYRRSVSFVISDFLSPDYERPLRLAQKRHDVIPICIDDPRETALPNVGLLNVRDLETGRYGVIDTGSASVRDLYASQRSRFVTRRRALFYKLGLDSVELNTEQPHFPALLGFFRRRERRLPQGR